MFPATGRNGENRDEARRRVRVLQASLVSERQRNGQEWIKCGACGWEVYPEENYCTECGADRLLVPAKIVRPWLIWLRRQALNWWVIPLPWVAVWVAPTDWETRTVCLALADVLLLVVAAQNCTGYALASSANTARIPRLAD